MANSSTAILGDDSGLLEAEGRGLMDMSLAPASLGGKADTLKQQIVRDIQNRNHAGAITGLQKALAVRKKDPRILRWLVIVASTADDLVLARKYARKLVDVEPGLAINQMFLGTVLDRLGRFDEAVKTYLKADRLSPGVPKTLLAIGHAHAARGDHVEALGYFEKTLEVDPFNDLALYHSAHSRKYEEVEALAFVERIERALPQTSDATGIARLHFSAGKVLDDAGRHDEAFLRFKIANELTTPSQPRDMSLLFRNTLAAFPDRNFFDARRGFGLQTDRPVFILGMPRSGTTLTESLCAAHPMVTAGDEQSAIGTLAGELGRDAADHGYAGMIAALTAEHAVTFARAYLEHCEQTVGAVTPCFTDKSPHNFLNIGLITLLFPEARIIHCRRHPLDSCLSLYSNQMADGFHRQYKTDLGRLGDHYRSYLDLMEHWRAVLPGKVHEVFYEDLVANTEWNARAIIDFLQLEWNDRVLERAGSQRRVSTASQWQVRQPVYQTSRNRWRRYEKHLGPLIEAIGPDRIDAYERDLATLDRD